MRTQIAHAFTHRFFTFNTNHNLAERTIRSFTVGRKNWLFANTPKGADASAILYSIVTTAKANGFNVYEHSTWLLDTIPNAGVQDDKALDTMLTFSDLLPALSSFQNKATKTTQRDG